MAKVIRGAAIQGSTSSTTGNVQVYTTVERDADLTKYWTDLTKEKMFPVAIWKIKQLFNASGTDEVALRVTDINDPEVIDARWLVFDGSYGDDLNDATTDNTYYFVLHESFFNGIIEVNEDVNTEGLFGSASFPYRAIIWGRVGQQANDDYTAFFDVADCPPIGDGGAGGDGALTGMRIPPGQ